MAGPDDAYNLRTLYDGQKVFAPNNVSDEDVNAYYGVKPPPPPPGPLDGVGVVGRFLGHSAIPMAAGVAAAVPGSAGGQVIGRGIGTAIGTVAGALIPVAGETGVGELGGAAIGGNIGQAIGSFVGGAGAMMTANGLAAKGQDVTLDAISPNIRKTLGWDEEQRAKDEAEHPYLSAVGEALPGLLAFRPSLDALKTLKGAAPAAAKAIVEARINLGIGTAFGAGSYLKNQLETGQDIDPKMLALQTVLGAGMGKATKIGRGINDAAGAFTPGYKSESMYSRNGGNVRALPETPAIEDRAPVDLLKPAAGVEDTETPGKTTMRDIRAQEATQPHEQTSLALPDEAAPGQTNKFTKTPQGVGPSAKDIPLHPDDAARLKPLLGDNPEESLQQLRDARRAIEATDVGLLGSTGGLRKQAALARIDAVLNHPDVQAFAKHADNFTNDQMDLLGGGRDSLFEHVPFLGEKNGIPPEKQFGASTAPEKPTGPTQTEMFSPDEAGAEPPQGDLFNPQPPSEGVRRFPTPGAEPVDNSAAALAAKQQRMGLQPPTSAGDILTTIRVGQPDPFTLKLASEISAAVQSGDPVALQRAMSTREAMMEHLSPHQRQVMEKADAYVRDALKTNMNPASPVTPDQQLRNQYAAEQARGLQSAPAKVGMGEPEPPPTDAATPMSTLQARAAGAPNRVVELPPENHGQSVEQARAANEAAHARVNEMHQQAVVDKALAIHHAETRAEVLRNVLGDPNTVNPEARFRNNLKRLGYRGDELRLTERERVQIAQDHAQRHPNRLPDTLPEEPDHQQQLVVEPKETTNGQGPDQNVAAPEGERSPVAEGTEKPAARKRSKPAAPDSTPRVDEAVAPAQPEVGGNEGVEKEVGEQPKTYTDVRDEIVRAEQHGVISKEVSMAMRRRLSDSEDAHEAGKQTLTPDDMHEMLQEAMKAKAAPEAAAGAGSEGPSAPGTKRWRPEPKVEEPTAKAKPEPEPKTEEAPVEEKPAKKTKAKAEPKVETKAEEAKVEAKAEEPTGMDALAEPERTLPHPDDLTEKFFDKHPETKEAERVKDNAHSELADVEGRTELRDLIKRLVKSNAIDAGHADELKSTLSEKKTGGRDDDDEPYEQAKSELEDYIDEHAENKRIELEDRLTEQSREEWGDTPRPKKGKAKNGGKFAKEVDEPVGAQQHDIGDAATIEEQNARREPLLKALRKELDRLGLHDVGLKVETWAENILGGREDAGLEGSYDENEKLINAIMAHGSNEVVTLHHEAFHAMEDLGLIKPAEREMLIKALSQRTDLVRMVEHLHEGTGDGIFENELMAHAYDQWKANKLEADLKMGPVGRFFQKLSNAFKAIKEMFVKSGYDTPEKLFDAIDRGVVGRRERGSSTLALEEARANRDQWKAGFAKKQSVIKYVLEGHTRNPDAEDLGKVNWVQHPAKTGYELVTSLKTPVREALANFTTMRQFEGEYGIDSHKAQLPEITHMIDNQNTRAALRDGMIHKASEVTNHLMELPPEDHKAVADLIYDAEADQTNVTKGTGPLQSRYNKMSAGAKEVYKAIIRHNRATADDAISILTDHVNAMDLPDATKQAMIAEHTAKLSRDVYMPHMWFGDYITIAHSGEYAKALAEHEASAKRVEELSKTPEDTDEVKAARQEATEAHNDLHRAADKGASQEKLDKLRQLRDEARQRLSDIAPPSEHPDLQAAKDAHAANAQKLADLSDNGHRMVVADESELAQKRRIEGLTKEGYTTETRKRQDFNEAPQGITNDYMQKLHEGFEQQRRANPEAKEAIDGMEKMARELMYAMRPTGSQLAAKLQRKGVAGFSRDIARSFAASAKRDAGYLAALRHGPEMNQLVTDMKAKAVKDNELAVVAKAIVDHYNALGKTAQTPVLDTLSNMTYAYMLGASPSFMAMHLMQTPMITLPWLHGKLGLGANVTGELLAAGKHFASTAGDSVWGEGMEHKGLSPDEQDNIKYLISRNIIAATHTDSLISMSERTTPMSRMGNVIMKVAGALPHYTEKFNRLMTAHAAYRLALAHPEMVPKVSDADHAAFLARTPELAHMTKEQLAASRFAEKAVADTHVDYSKQNAPNAFNNAGALKFMYQFQKYQQGMLHLLGDSAIKSLKGETPEIKAAAGRTLAGVITTHAALTGAMGLPLVGTAMFLANMYHKLFGDKNEAFDAEDTWRQSLVKTFGHDGGEVAMRGVLYNPWTKGILPADITDRLGLGDMLSPGAKVDAVTRQNFQLYVANVAGGPAGSLIAQFADAFDMHHKGEDWRAAEDLMPKVAKDISKTIRFANYGVTTTSNNHVIAKGELTPADLVVQGLGFEPQRIQEAYANREAVQSAKAELDDRRKVLIKRLTDARLDGDQDKIDMINSEIQAFNSDRIKDRLFGERITGNSLTKAYLNRRQQDRFLSGGVSTKPKERALREFMIDPEAGQ